MIKMMEIICNSGVKASVHAISKGCETLDCLLTSSKIFCDLSYEIISKFSIISVSECYF